MLAISKAISKSVGKTIARGNRVGMLPLQSNIPDQFTITDQTGVAISTLITSAPVSVTGLIGTAIISVLGGAYRLNGSGSFISTPSEFTPGDTFEVQITSAADNDTTVNAIVTINGISDTFTVTTLAFVNLILNGDASDTTSTDSSVAPIVGFTNVGTHNATNKIIIESGEFKIISSGDLVGFLSTYEFANGAEIEISFDITTITSGALVVGVGGFSGQITVSPTTFSTTGSKVVTVIMDAYKKIGFKRSVGATNIKFDNIVARVV